MITSHSILITLLIQEIEEVLQRSGFMTVLGTEVMVPGSDLEYYKVYFKTDSFFEINKEKEVVL